MPGQQAASAKQEQQQPAEPADIGHLLL